MCKKQQKSSRFRALFSSMNQQEITKKTRENVQGSHFVEVCVSIASQIDDNGFVNLVELTNFLWMASGENRVVELYWAQNTDCPLYYVLCYIALTQTLGSLWPLNLTQILMNFRRDGQNGGDVPQVCLHGNHFFVERHQVNLQYKRFKAIKNLKQVSCFIQKKNQLCL